MQPLVSIIIPTRNSSKTLNECLESIKKQKYGKIEIIIVDQSSTDSTKEITKKYSAKLISVPRPEKYTPPTKSRNIGVAASSGEIIYNMDSDMIMSDGLIEEIVNIFNNSGDVGAIVVHEKDTANTFWGKAKAFERSFYQSNKWIESARAVRKIVFIKSGGYDENINIGEDFDIHERYSAITKIGSCKNIILHNLLNKNFCSFIIKNYYYGKTYKKYAKKSNKRSVYFILTQEFICFAKNYKSFLRHPIIGFAAIFLKILEMSAGFAGSLSSKY